jgi:hypothetical protein
LRKKTIKGGSALRLQAMLLFSQEVNSIFEAGVEGFIRCLKRSYEITGPLKSDGSSVPLP